MPSPQRLPEAYPTRLLAHARSRAPDITPGLPVACKRYWAGRDVSSPRGNFLGFVRRVLACEHNALCDGVCLEILWDDGLISYYCSYNEVGAGQEYDQVLD